MSKARMLYRRYKLPPDIVVMLRASIVMCAALVGIGACWLRSVPCLAQAAADGKTVTKTPSQRRGPDYVDSLVTNLKPTRKVVYKTVGGRDLQLHVFEPKGHQPTDRRPCFVIVHGGGWTSGVPSRMYPFADHAATLGMVGISVEYRLMKKEAGLTPFECVKDGRSAVRYVREHAAEFGIDPQKIVVSGGSAGGHVAAGTALFDGVDEPGEGTSVSSIPNALVLYFPVIDTSEKGYGNGKVGSRWQELSPLHRVKAGSPPTIIFHGTGDTVTPFAGAQEFCDAMHKAGNRCELIVNEGGLHGYLMRDRTVFEDALRKTDAFLATLGFCNKP